MEGSISLSLEFVKLRALAFGVFNVITRITTLPRSTWGRLAALLFGAATTVLAAQTPAPTPDPQALDLELQSLKAETLSLTRELREAELGRLYPAGSRTSFYVSVKVPGFVLDGISVRINDRDSTAHRYTDAESRALMRDGWHRLNVQSLEPGTYRLQADFQGHFADARGTDPAIRGRLETLFEKKAGADLDLVLPISRNTRLEKPALSEIARQESRLTRPGRNVWLPEPESVKAPDPSRPIGGDDDPRYRSAVYNRLGQRYVAALDDLLDIEAEAADPAKLPVEFQRLLADCYLGFGMQAAAEAVFTRLASAQTPDPVKLAQGQLDMANYEYQRGHLNAATVRLYRMKETLPKAVFEDWRKLLTFTLMQQGEYKDVATLLLPQGGNIDDAQDLPPVLRYNLAVALMKSDNGLHGRKLMNRVGQIEVKDIESLSLRDKANLSLGYQYLQLQNGENAKALFGRVRTTGPFSGNALLGLGWAEIAIATSPNANKPEEEEGKGLLGSIADLFGVGGDKKESKKKIDVKGSGGIPAREADGMQRALIPWAELIERDPMDSAVQEAMLAIPWALQKVGAYEDALKYYQRAIDTLEVARKRMAQAQTSISSGVMVYTMIKDDLDSERGWRWRLSNLADTPETYFLQSLLAEHRFMESLKDHRDARLLGRTLETWKQRLDDAEKAWRADLPAANAEASVSAELSAGDAAAELNVDAGADVAVASAPPPPASPVLALRSRLERLAPRITQNGVAQNQVLETISLKELAGQQEQIEKYLTEARFSVARIFDSQMKGP